MTPKDDLSKPSSPKREGQKKSTATSMTPSEILSAKRGTETTATTNTNMNTYNTMMTALYGNDSANKYQNNLNALTGSAEEGFATAKSFVEKMKENDMSNRMAVKTYHALQRYSLMSSFGNYNFINAKV